MSKSLYGVSGRTRADNEVARHAEEIRLRGYSIVGNLFSTTQLETWGEKLDVIYERQASEFGRELLVEIGDLDTCRAPLLYDFTFMEIASHPLILAIAREILGNWIILNLQNGIINRPHLKHQQAAWHRDLPHQNFVISNPLSISVLVAIDAFTTETGCTQFIPFSHRSEFMPSEFYTTKCAIDVEAPAGSAILFDSMLFHRAGHNSSGRARRAINHLFTLPILKQYYDLPRALGERDNLTPEQEQLLGYTSQVPLDDRAWRTARVARLSQSR